MYGFANLTFMVPCIMMYLTKMTNKMQLCMIIYCSLKLYMFRAILSLIIRSITTVFTASGIIHVCGCVPTQPGHQPAATYVNNTRSCKYSCDAPDPTQLHLVGSFSLSTIFAVYIIPPDRRRGWLEPKKLATTLKVRIEGHETTLWGLITITKTEKFPAHESREYYICFLRNSLYHVLTLRRLMSYIYGVPILDVSRSHTTTQHSR